MDDAQLEALEDGLLDLLVYGPLAVYLLGYADFALFQGVHYLVEIC